MPPLCSTSRQCGLGFHRSGAPVQRFRRERAFEATNHQSGSQESPGQSVRREESPRVRPRVLRRCLFLSATCPLEGFLSACPSEEAPPACLAGLSPARARRSHQSGGVTIQAPFPPRDPPARSPARRGSSSMKGSRSRRSQKPARCPLRNRVASSERAQRGPGSGYSFPPRLADPLWLMAITQPFCAEDVRIFRQSHPGVRSARPHEFCAGWI